MALEVLPSLITRPWPGWRELAAIPTDLILVIEATH